MRKKAKFGAFGRQLLFLGTFLMVFTGTFVIAQTAPKEDYAASLAAALEPDRKVVYKTLPDRSLSLHIFEPNGVAILEKKPVFVAFHGGAWAGGAPRRFYPIVSHMADKGMVGISAEYRLLQKGDSTTVYECVKDARSVVRYLRQHADEFGIDPDKIIVSGGSAGAHLAVGTALFDEINEPEDDLKVSCVPNALVLYYPVIDTSPEGYGNKTIGSGWQTLSPLHRVRSGMPPVVVFHGTDDTVTPFGGAAAFKKAMDKAGNHCELYANEGGIHGYMMFQKPLYEEAMEKTAAFLSALGYIDRERESEWKPLFTNSLSNAVFPKGIWRVENGELTATEDQPIWTQEVYENFELDLEFKNAAGTNSGVFIYADTSRWISHSVEVQIADDYDSVWANKPKSWQCGAIFGHQSAIKQSVRPAGEWNHYRIVCGGQNVKVYLNGVFVNELAMNRFTSAQINPDGTPIASWLSLPLAELPTRGHIGFQGKHAGKPIWFRNVRIKTGVKPR
jgi:acetyl esterase/lipase